ncbi:unnamed protein product [Spirodela intermedia]|uniref:(S)-ureidoglycine aminohydrolase cupin domain-containing protein n=1 Tax=Spirodela intermedia TaxID=51605 RepID=A0A7I8J1H6_SPIIN|nr:unnamed protein product [Spirodela intermedia]CAA6663909.1 unnamed protein product [Spirodela intermedia]
MASPVMGLRLHTVPGLTSAGFSRRLPLSELRGREGQRWWRAGIRAEAMATERLGVKVLKNAPEEKLAELGVRSWPKWGCPPSRFPWEYTSKETYEFVEIEAGDLVEFPKGMKCTWDVSVTVDKHYDFE